MTEAMAHVLHDVKLGGLVVEVQRPGRRRNGEILCRVIDRPLKDRLPPAFDVVPILLRMWRLQAVERACSPGDDDQGGEVPDVIPFQRPDLGDVQEA